MQYGECIDKKNKGILDALELLTYVDKICRENNIQYTLLFTTLLSAVEEQNFVDWLRVVQIGLVYEDYKRLLEILEEKSIDGEMYPITYEKDNIFCEQFCRLYKRSKIKLSQNRKKEERFYDNFINIFPIYYVSNSMKDLKKIQKEYIEQRKYITARAITPGTINLRNVFKKIKAYIYYKKRDEYSVQKLNNFLESKHDIGNKYALIPWGAKQKGAVALADTYRRIEDFVVGDRTFMKIVDAKKWIDEIYTTEKKKNIKNGYKNVVLQQGTETLRRVQLIALDILIEFDRICRKYDIKYILAAGTLLGAVRHKGFIPWDDDVDVFMLYEEWQKFVEVYEKEIDNERFFVRTQETDVDDNLCFFQIKHNNTIYCKEGRKEYNTHRGVFIDILPYYNGANNYLSHKIQEKVCKFLKTVTWAHMGAQSERIFVKRKWYEFLQKNISNKSSSSLFYKIANRYAKSEYLCYLYVKRNPYKKGINQRKYFEDLVEIEFENHMFYVPREYEEFLEYSYSKDYMMYPSVNNQMNHHFPADIELGELHIIE